MAFLRVGTEEGMADKDPLNPVQIKMAEIEIEKLHPIQDTTWDIVFPWACCCVKKWRQRQERKEQELLIASGILPAPELPKAAPRLRHAATMRFGGLDTLDENGERKKLPNDEHRWRALQEKEKDRKAELKKDIEYFGDPFQTFGFGLVAYRMTISKLAAVMILFSILSYPIMKTYNSGTASLDSKYGKYTLGNLGYNTVRCKNSIMAMKMFQIQCPYGRFEKLTHFGINPEGETFDACMAKEEFKNQVTSGDEYLDKAAIQGWFDTNCSGQQECAAKFSVDGTPNNNPKTSTEDWLRKPFCTSSNPNDCIDSFSKFFMQYTCTVVGDQFKDKYNKIALASATVTFIAFVFGALVYYMQKTSKLDMLDFDMNTITAGDFTVEMDLTKSQYSQFIEQETQNGSTSEYDSVGLHFKMYIKEHVEKLLSKTRREAQEKEEEIKNQEAIIASRSTGFFSFKPQTSSDNKPKRNHISQEGEDRNKVNIIDIQFAYNNYYLINLLKKRGKAIAALDFEQMRSIERDVIDLIMNTSNGEVKKDSEGFEIVEAENDPNDAYDKLTRPVCAFITFESDDGYLEALNYSKRGWFARKYAEWQGNDPEGFGPILLGKAINFIAASEPTNIIWENRHIKGVNYYFRFLAAGIWLSALICGSFFIIFLAKKESIINQHTFSGIDCNNFKQEILTQHPQWLKETPELMTVSNGACQVKILASLKQMKSKFVEQNGITEEECTSSCFEDFLCDASEWNPQAVASKKCKHLIGKKGTNPSEDSATQNGEKCSIKNWELLESGKKDSRGEVTKSLFVKEFTRLAGLEFLAREKAESKGADIKKIPMNGCIECFCKEEQLKAGGLAKYSYAKAYNLPYTYKDQENKDKKSQLCKTFYWDKLYASGLSNAVKYSIIIMNTIIRMVVIASINWVGCDDSSTQMQHITSIVFICQFFNTGCLLLLCNANFDGQGFFFGRFFVSGYATDFNSDWFDTFGDTIVGAMIFNIWYPFVGEFIWAGIRSLKRYMDKSKAPEGSTTACTTQQQYIDIYCGAEFLMHYKYSAMLNTTFITMMYGAGLPILFPIAAAQLIVFYVLENYKFYWSYRQPPAYDEKLNTYCLKTLEKAPLILLGFAYWMFSNHQLLQKKSSTLTPLEKTTDAFLAEHYWYEAFTYEGIIDSGAPGAGTLLICFFLYFIWIVASGPISYMLGCCCKFAMLDELEINEDIDRYTNCLDDDDKDWTVQEELNMRNCYGIKCYEDRAFEAIQNGHMKSPIMHLQGVHTYDLLRNPSYIKEFQYFAANDYDRESVIKDDDDTHDNDASQSDLVRICLNLAYIDKSRLRREIGFDGLLKNGLAKIKKENVIQIKQNGRNSIQ